MSPTVAVPRVMAIKSFPKGTSDALTHQNVIFDLFFNYIFVFMVFWISKLLVACDIKSTT